MALQRHDELAYGDDQADIREYLREYSAAGYPAQHFADAVCVCGARHFSLAVDETEGVAVRMCILCDHEHVLADGEEFLDESALEVCECLCGESTFEITAGVALYPDSEDLRWFYVGCRCVHCRLTGCYGDWKNEASGYEDLLKRV